MHADKSRYLVRPVLQAFQVLSAFQTGGEVLNSCHVAERTGFPLGTCRRFLFTLRECGLLEEIGENQYRLAAKQSRRRYRIGFGSQGHDSSFARAVLSSVNMAASREGIELIVVDNCYSPKVALRNVEQLIREHVDLAIEFQTDEAVAADVAGKYRCKNIPMIAVDIPHPGATYFGANNYEAGLMAGRHLGRWTNLHWQGSADAVLIVELSRAGWVSQTRLRGAVNGLNEVLTQVKSPVFHRLEGDGQFGPALSAVRRYLRNETQKDKRVLIVAANDSSAMGALRAFEEAGIANHCAVVGHNAEPEARAEMRQPRSRFVGSVAFFPEEYGDHLMPLAIAILEQRSVSRACFIKHKLITQENVDHHYPNDPLLGTV